MANRNVAHAVRVALVTAGALGAGLTGVTSFAQEQLDEVVITGTRIRTPGLVANSPIASIGAEEIAYSAPAAVEEFFKGLPGAVPAIGPGTNNGSGGGATIDLRGLGSNRTLVLMDGRRIVPFNLSGSVDTNAIPIALIERVDLVTGGASAVYGADAVSGVVNFILKKDFDGINISSTYGTSQDSDATKRRTDLTIGANTADGRGNVVFSIGHTDTEPVRQDARPIGLRSLSSVFPGNPQGSGTTVPAVVQVSAAFPIVGGVCTGPTPASCVSLNGQMNAAGAIVPLYETYNFNPDNYYQTPLQRLQVTTLGNYTINDYAELYGQALFTRSDVRQQLAPSGLFLNVFQVPIGNPYIPQLARDQICAARGIDPVNCVVGNPQEVPITFGRRLVELGPRLGDFENKLYQYTAGIRGDITDRWSYDAYFTHGEADQLRTLGNWGSLSKSQQALRALNTTTCTSTANGCVPLNPWGAAGSITPAMVNFINLSSFQTQTVEQEVYSGFVTGDLGDWFKSPWAGSPIGAAFGVEYRELTAGNRSDSASQIQGEVMGTGAPLPDRRGTFDLKEAFAELLIPVLQDKPFAHSLTIEAGYRHTEFTVSQTNDYGSYKYGLEWAPIEDLRLRGMFQRATRAPNVNELFQPQVSGLSNLAVDPCQLALINVAQANTAGTLSNLCRLTGVPLVNIGTLQPPSAGQVNVRTGGNPLLGAEEADTTTIGFVWQPSFVPNLSVSVDYWEIELNEAISTPSVNDILDQCYTTAFNPTLAFVPICNLVQRGPSSGSFNGVDAPGIVLFQSNQGFNKVDGFDLIANYSFALSDVGLGDNAGRLAFALNLTKLESSDFQATPTSVYRECAGYYSIPCGQPNIEWKWNMRTTWTVSDFDFSLNWRHIGDSQVEPLVTCGTGTASTTCPSGTTNWNAAFRNIGAYDYIDLSGGWNVNETIRVTLAVQNITDKAAPNVGNTIGGTATNSGNTYPQTYDVIGRFYTLGMNFKF